ncbi:hypothetical protein EJB05_28001 [Eragrostis curvula]|uniref:DUF7866 domain-containing protein n=1 Tax=Eragrostis curvula TaxID=38414 RepID=A0A5J9UP14_9POAL|nr:hypothetical protein EJB05_28001 [Eragrostis curvula]
MASSSPSPRPPIPLFLLISLLAVSTILAASAQQDDSSSSNVTVAAAAETAWTPRLRKTFLDGGLTAGRWRGRRLVGRFQVCAVCTCCGGPHGMCIPAPCCYAINCNIPNRPFGVCSFTPRTCNCLSCHL